MTRQNILKISLVAIVVLFIVAFSPSVSFAQINSQLPTGAGTTPAPTTSTLSGSLNPFAGGSTLCSFLVAILNLITEIGAVIGALTLIGVGFFYIYARGNKEKLQTAHRAIGMSLLGITLLLGASVLAHILITTVNAVLTAGGGNFANQSALTCSP